jgi:hypothetical protein
MALMSNIATEQRDDAIRRRSLIIERDFERRRRRKRGQRPSIATLRICELNRLFFTRYRGRRLPNDDDGRDNIFIMVNHLVMLADPQLRTRDWFRQWAPWFSEREAESLIERTIIRPIKWKADTLAKRLNLADAERSKLAIKTIGAIDCTKAQRASKRRQQKRLAKEAKRRAAGAKAQSRSASRTKPWEDLSISRSTWYRQMRQFRTQYKTCSTVPETIPGTPLVAAGHTSRQKLASPTLQQSHPGRPSFGLSKSPSRAAIRLDGGHVNID